MKVLFITCWYPHGNFPYRGIFVKEHAEAVFENGITVKIFHLWAEFDRKSVFRVEEKKYLDASGVETVSVIINSMFSNWIYGFTPLLKRIGYYYYRKYYDGYSPDLIHGHVIFQAGRISEYFSKKLSIPYLISEHWSKLEWYFNHLLLSFSAQETYEQAKYVLPVSGFLKNKIATVLPDADLPEVRTIPNVVDPEVFRFKGAENRSGITECLLVMNFDNDQKYPELLFKAIAILSVPDQKKFRFRLIGDTKEKDMVNYVESMGVKSNIIYEGVMDKNEIAAAMNKADFFIQPTRMETFGITVAEALCCGLPCIVSNVGALPELVDEQSGILINNDIVSWKRVLEDIISDKYRFNRKEISEKNRNRFYPAKVGRELISIYSEILN